MKISIITPGYNMLEYLIKCHASIVDQKRAVYEHIVIDGGSADGTAEWLTENSIKGVSEPDNGMYDAVNKGLKMADGEIMAYLNCDEQYLPGTLEAVSDFFENNPDVDIIFGNMVLTRPDGSLLSYRKCYQPRWSYISASHLYVASCTMFFRRRIVDEGFLFNTAFRAAGDEDFVVRILKAGYRAACFNRYLAAFVMTGSNMSRNENALKEEDRLYAESPGWVKIFRPVLNILRLTEKLISGGYREKAVVEYEVYVDSDRRQHFSVAKATQKWKWG